MNYKDYLEIVLNGYINNREYLDKYFIRKFKEAESKNYVFGEFFKGCLNVVAALDKKLKEQYYSDKKEFQENLKFAISTNDNDAENHFRERLNELNELKECNYSVNLYQFTKGKFTGDLDCEDIKYIALSIGLAIKTIQEQTTNDPNPATSSETEPPATGENNSLDVEPINPHQRIFPNGKCWQLFEYWKENAKDIKADLCFAYWQMIEDKLMYKITPTQFTDWLLQKLSINFDGYWKQLHRINKPDRKRLYSMAKLQFQLNKSQY